MTLQPSDIPYADNPSFVEWHDYAGRKSIERVNPGMLANKWRPDSVSINNIRFTLEDYKLSELFTLLFGEEAIREIYGKCLTVFTKLFGTETAINNFAEIVGTSIQLQVETRLAGGRPLTVTGFVLPLEDQTFTTDQQDYLRTAVEFLLAGYPLTRIIIGSTFELITEDRMILHTTEVIE